MEKMRDLQIDSLKGFLIISIILVHIPIPPHVHAVFLVIKNILLFFNVPLFFAISTIFIKNVSEQYIFQRIRLLIIPYIFWYFCEYNKLSSPYFIHSPINYLKQIPDNFINFSVNFCYGNWPHLESVLWFLPALLVINLVWVFYKKYFSNNNIYKIFFGLFYIYFFLKVSEITVKYHFYIPWGLDIAVYLMPYLLCINYVYKNKLKFLKETKTNFIILILVLILAIAVIILVEPTKTVSMTHGRIDFSQFFVPSSVAGYIAMIVLSSSILLIFFKMHFLKKLSYIGRYTFSIFVMHIPIITFIQYYFWKVLYVNNNFVFLVAIYVNVVFSIIIPIILSKILMKVSKKFIYIGAVE